jgi:hypothetical protein
MRQRGTGPKPTRASKPRMAYEQNSEIATSLKIDPESAADWRRAEEFVKLHFADKRGLSAA